MFYIGFAAILHSKKEIWQKPLIIKAFAGKFGDFEVLIAVQIGSVSQIDGYFWLEATYLRWRYTRNVNSLLRQ